MICKFCKVKKAENDGQWWVLRHNEFYGNCCPQCYECVALDSFGKPRNPELYAWFLLKYGFKQRG